MHPTHIQDADVQDWTPAEILRAAARYLARYGWTQGVYYNLAGLRAYRLDPSRALSFPPACAIGAMAMTVYGEIREAPESDSHARDIGLAQVALLDYLDLDPYADPEVDPYDEDPDPQPVGVYAWNDSQCSAGDVIYALRKAADAWDGQHTTGGAE